MTPVTAENRAGYPALASLLRAWWRAPVDDRWLVKFLGTRGALKALQVLVGAGGLVLAVIVVLVQFAAGGPQGVVGRAADAVIAAAAVAWALAWWFGPWPSPARSLLLVAGADAAITVACLQDTDRLASVTGTMLFVVTGAFLTFFHGPKPLACHVIWASLTILGLTVWMGIDQGLPGLAMASAKALIVLAGVVGILPAVQFGYWLVHTSAIDSLVDPLTGLANRRGFKHHCQDFAAIASAVGLCAIAIDLDAFKTINDAHGHRIGDEVLVRTADRIRAAVRSRALVARLGGEEFIVIDQVCEDAAAVMCERIRASIAAPPLPAVTASIGLAIAEQRPPLDAGDAIAELAARADDAMYRAKRRGGNTVEVHWELKGSP